MAGTPLTSRNLWNRSPTPTTVCKSSLGTTLSLLSALRQSDVLYRGIPWWHGQGASQGHDACTARAAASRDTLENNKHKSSAQA